LGPEEHFIPYEDEHEEGEDDDGDENAVGFN
jgi:hypothetical protein